MKLDDGFDWADPYDQVALIYGIFACECCPDFIGSDAQNVQPYHVTGQTARKAGWFVEANGNDWRILCPQCKSR